jgi:hypothetical protein
MSFVEKRLFEWLQCNYAKTDVKLSVGGSARGWWFWNDVVGCHEKYGLLQLKEMFNEMSTVREVLTDLVPVEISWGDVT